MAKKCKLIHINDGTATEIVNGNRHFVEEYTWAEDYLNRYLREGYELKHMVPMVTPSLQQEGNYTFYKSGFTFYLEREETEEDAPEEPAPVRRSILDGLRAFAAESIDCSDDDIYEDFDDLDDWDDEEPVPANKPDEDA